MFKVKDLVVRVNAWDCGFGVQGSENGVEILRVEG